MDLEIEGRSPAVQAWYRAYRERSALLDEPQVYTAALRVQAEALHAAGEVDAAELADMLEGIDAAYGWAAEELISREQDV